MVHSRVEETLNGLLEAEAADTGSTMRTQRGMTGVPQRVLQSQFYHYTGKCHVANA